ncbi:MAG: CotH kinase family protein, partial [Lachnospiraceae bacterium]
MAQNKHISKIIAGVMAVAVLLCFLAIGYSDKLNERFGGTGVTMEYESKLFDTSEIISIDIKMDEEQWNTMLQNASSEEYYVCDVVINGLRVNNVAIRPKGNTSLSAIAMDPDSDRFSLKLEFDHFMDGQTCYGLDKLILNNNYADATNMKEAIIYDMYQYIGAEASLYNYAKVSLNGEYWGVYLALEGVEQSFMLRNFGTQDGELYKPDSMEMGGGGDFGNFKIVGAKKPKSRSNSKSDSTTSDSSNSDSSSSDSSGSSGGFSFGGFGGFGGSSDK